MNAQIRAWLDEAVEAETAVWAVEEYVRLSVEAEVELERIEAVEREEFWVEWRQRREEVRSGVDEAGTVGWWLGLAPEEEEEIEESEEERWDRAHWEALEVETIRQIIEADREEWEK